MNHQQASKDSIQKTKDYNPSEIEPKWQKIWQQKKVYFVDTQSAKNTTDNESDSQKTEKPAYYALDMLPYPSGAGMHVGHLEGYVATDIVSRYQRMKGHRVIHPMGWDSFGLPAENYALKVGRHPKALNEELVARFKHQLQIAGLSYDWSKEVNTADPEYIKWTQWFFLLMYKNGLAYRKEAPVNWCPSCQTVLANEQVIDGVCERCDTPVEHKPMNQWFFKITEYADRLLEDLEELDWPESTKMGQRNWIGRSEGVEITFNLEPTPPIPHLQGEVSSSPHRRGTQGQVHKIKVFTTAHDTIFAATFFVLSPEHPQLDDMKSNIKNWDQVKEYIQQAKNKSDLERQQDEKQKTGVKLAGITAINSFNGKQIPVFVADYVLMGYGTGAVMGVPGHDARDHQFAQKFKLPVEIVIQPTTSAKNPQVDEDGFWNYSDIKTNFKKQNVIVNSDWLNGLKSTEAKEKVADYLDKNSLGKRVVNYKLRDWLISRQRYWGAPIPMIYCHKCGEVPLEIKDLPLELPDIKDIKPKGQAPLASDPEFVNVTCPKCGGKAKRETDTMDGFVDNSWYYYRYLDPHNSEAFCDKHILKKFAPVDLYVGGAEHTVGHLNYSRFYTKVLYDQGYVDFKEPFLKLRHPGIVLAEDSRKMSKRWGNVINPDDVISEFGADAVRLYEMFMGPFSDSIPWSNQGLVGCRRFLDKVWGLYTKKQLYKKTIEQSEKLTRKLQQTIKKVTDDIQDFKFNTAIAAMMELVNVWREEGESMSQEDAKKFLLILAPFAPHIAEELWQNLNSVQIEAKSKLSLEFDTIHLHPWPSYDESLLAEETITIPVQINGKVRGTIQVNSEDATNEQKIIDLAKSNQQISKWIPDGKIKKTIFIPGKLINLLVIKQ